MIYFFIRLYYRIVSPERLLKIYIYHDPKVGEMYLTPSRMYQYLGNGVWIDMGVNNLYCGAV